MDSGTGGGNFVLQNGKITTLGAPNFLFSLAGTCQWVLVSCAPAERNWLHLSAAGATRLQLVVLLPLGVLQETIFYKRSNSYRAHRRYWCAAASTSNIINNSLGVPNTFFSVSTEICNRRREKKARERPSSANNTWLCVRAADLIMRFGGNFPNKAQKNMAPPSS